MTLVSVSTTSVEASKSVGKSLIYCHLSIAYLLTKTGWKLYCDPILMFIIKTAKMGSCWRPLKCHRTFTCIGCVRVCVVWFSKKNAGVFWKQRVCGFCSDFWTIACTNRKFSCAATGFQSAAVNLPAAILLSLWSVFSTVISYKLSNLKSSSITYIDTMQYKANTSGAGNYMYWLILTSVLPP